MEHVRAVVDRALRGRPCAPRSACSASAREDWTGRIDARTAGHDAPRAPGRGDPAPRRAERRRPRMDPPDLAAPDGGRCAGRAAGASGVLVVAPGAGHRWPAGLVPAAHSPIFGARAVTVSGAVHSRRRGRASQAGLAGHPPLLDVDPGAVAARIEQLPWVRRRRSTWQWPDGVHIAVTEEAPRSPWRPAGGRLGLGERRRTGRWPVSPARPPGLVLADGPGGSPGGPGSMLPARDAAGLRVATTLPASFAAQVTAVTVEPAGWVQLALIDPVTVDIGSPAELTAKYEDVSSILAGATLHSGDVIDVSVPERTQRDARDDRCLTSLNDRPYRVATLPHCEHQPSAEVQGRVAGRTSPAVAGRNVRPAIGRRSTRRRGSA